MATNLQDLDLDDFPEIASLLRESKKRWLVEGELNSIYLQRISNPLRLPISSGKPKILTTGIYFMNTEAYRDKNKWDRVNHGRNVQSNNIFRDDEYTCTEAVSTSSEGRFVRRTQRRRSKYKELALVHYRWEVVNNEDQQVEEEVMPKEASSSSEGEQVEEGVMRKESSSSSEGEQVEEDVMAMEVSSSSISSVQKKKSLKETPKILEASSSVSSDSEADWKKKQAEKKKTLFVTNLSYQVERSDVENFFKEAGEIVDVRFATDRDGSFRGFGFVEFASAEAAEKGLQLSGKPLLRRIVWIEFAHERGAGCGGRACFRGK